MMGTPLNASRRRFLLGSGAALLAGFSSRARGAQDSAPLPTIDDWIRQRAAAAPLGLQFRGTSAEDCRRWQAEFAARLRTLLGPHRPPDKWQSVVRRVTDLHDHRREELLLQAEGHPPLPVYLLLPRPKAAKRRAGVLALHGHGEHGYHPVVGRDDLPGVAEAIRSANYDYGRQLVRRG